MPNQLITITSLPGKGYGARTRHNAERADLTVAFAIDYQTTGEQATRKFAGEKYLSIPFGFKPIDAAKKLLNVMSDRNVSILNIAGHGLHTLGRHGKTQSDTNKWLFEVLRFAHDRRPIQKIVSGGQTGIDTAAAVAGVALGIEVDISYPDGFLRRGADGKDYPGDPSGIEAEIRDMSAALGKENNGRFKEKPTINFMDYNGQTVDKLLLEKALDFMIKLELCSSQDSMDDYRSFMEANKGKVEKAKGIMRKYGEQIAPFTLEHMQDVFYGITNSEKYASDAVKCSVVRSCLTDAWHGVGEWRQ